MFSEPQPTPYDLRFHVLGIPVRVHPMFWLAGLILGIGGNPKPAQIVIWISVFFGSILLHEMGHALVARAHGWDPWITLYGFGGLASYRPTNSSPLAQLLIAAAGPGIGFVFAAIVIAVVQASGHRVEFGWDGGLLPVRFEFFESWQMNVLIYYLLQVNILWGLINLIPVIPLDGGQIARQSLELINPGDGLRQALWLSIITGVVVALLAWQKLHEPFIAILFAALAYSNFQTLQSYFGRPGGFR